jgi:hypothetical protein
MQQSADQAAQTCTQYSRALQEISSVRVDASDRSQFAHDLYLGWNETATRTEANCIKATRRLPRHSFPLAGASRPRVWSVIQFTSQVLPPSSEKGCSKWAEFGVMPDQAMGRMTFGDGISK